MCDSDDVGDWVVVDGDWFLVLKIHLNYTILQNLEGKQAMWRNSVLRTKHPLENLSRAGQQYSEQWTLAIDNICFAEGLLETVAAELKEYLRMENIYAR